MPSGMKGHGVTERLVESVTVQDPLFTDEDVNEILDFLEYEASLCPGCGLPKHETFSEDMEWAYRGETLACHACAARRRAEKKLDDIDGVYSFVEELGH